MISRTGPVWMCAVPCRRRGGPSIRCVPMTGDDDESVLIDSVLAAAWGCLSKQDDSGEQLKLIRRVLAGQTAYSGRFLPEPVGQASGQRADHPGETLLRLSNWEASVALGLAGGLCQVLLAPEERPKSFRGPPARARRRRLRSQYSPQPFGCARQAGGRDSATNQASIRSVKTARNLYPASLPSTSIHNSTGMFIMVAGGLADRIGRVRISWSSPSDDLGVRYRRICERPAAAHQPRALRVPLARRHCLRTIRPRPRVYATPSTDAPLANLPAGQAVAGSDIYKHLAGRCGRGRDLLRAPVQCACGDHRCPLDHGYGPQGGSLPRRSPQLSSRISG